MSTDDRVRPRLVDVAKAAGVSVSTASRALGRGGELIAASTRDHVRAVARTMGYQANPIARSLRLATAGAIGMVVPSISNPFYIELVEQVEHCLAERGLNLLLCDSRMSVINENRQLRSLESGAVDGLLVVPLHQTYSTPAVERTASIVPTVQLDRGVHDASIPTIGVDDPDGMDTVLRHLLERGVRRIAMLANTGSELSSDTRITATVSCAARLGIELREEDSIECAFSVEAGAAAVRRILQRTDLPDAIVCLNDLLAIGAITQLRRAKISVPDQVMVTGFDDIQFAALMHPSITTFRQPLADIARHGVEILLADKKSQGHIVVPGHLVVRESTSPMRRT